MTTRDTLERLAKEFSERAKMLRALAAEATTYPVEAVRKADDVGYARGKAEASATIARLEAEIARLRAR